MENKKKRPFVDRLDRLEHLIRNDIMHELRLHRWLLGLILAAGASVLVALVVKALVG